MYLSSVSFCAIYSVFAVIEPSLLQTKKKLDRKDQIVGLVYELANVLTEYVALTHFSGCNPTISSYIRMFQ